MSPDPIARNGIKTDVLPLSNRLFSKSLEDGSLSGKLLQLSGVDIDPQSRR